MFYFRQFISSPGNYPFCQYIIRQSRNKVGKTAYVPTYFYFYNLIGTFFSFFSNLISFFYFSRIYFSAISPTMSFFYLLVGTFLPFFPFYKHSHRTICLFLSDYFLFFQFSWTLLPLFIPTFFIFFANGRHRCLISYPTIMSFYFQVGISEQRDLPTKHFLM